MDNSNDGYSLLWETILQKEAYPIFRIAYTSKAMKPFTDEDFYDIEQKSQTSNSKRDVTGILIVHDEKILQVLEGRETEVRELYAKIKADPRHTITKLVCEIETEERILLTWNMIVRKIDNIPSDVLEQYVHLYDELQGSAEATPIDEEHIELLKLISLFAPLAAI